MFALGSVASTASARQHRSRCWTQHDLQPVQGNQVSEFTTHFKVEDYYRASNVRRAAKRLDGIVIGPKQTLSYNDTVGPRTEEAGFQYAPVIFRGELQYRPGGGVCQPSSTLHAAAILCGLQVLKRRSHSWQSSYIASGFDAAVAWRSKDLILKNPYSFPVKIAAEIGETHLTIRLFAKGAPNAWFDLETTPVSKRSFTQITELSDQLPPGETQIHRRGIKGLRLARTMVRTKPDGSTKRKKWSMDVYRPRTQVVRIGADSNETNFGGFQPSH